MPGYVIEYNRKTGNSRVTSFESPDGHRQAVAERLRLEKISDRDSDVEIVALMADSLASLRRSHSRYFLRAASAV